MTTKNRKTYVAVKPIMDNVFRLNQVSQSRELYHLLLLENS